MELVVFMLTRCVCVYNHCGIVVNVLSFPYLILETGLLFAFCRWHCCHGCHGCHHLPPLFVKVLLGDDMFVEVAGVFEYDLELKEKGEHRKFLTETAAFKQVGAWACSR